VPEALSAALDAHGITEPFPIQAATLADSLSGADLCGRAPTGSGKTLAFGLPVLAGVAARRSSAKPGRPLALILLPTRELAAQVAAVLTPLARSVGASVAAVYGGVGFGPQRAALRRGVDVLVGCPGRIEDLIGQGDLDLSEVHWAVLDEADRMCDMGFLPAVRRLLDRVGPDRQVLLFSATLDGDVEGIIRRYLDQPRRHDVIADEERTGQVTHRWWRTDRERRIELTARLAAGHRPTIVFCRTRHGADRLTRRLETLGLRAAAIHGDRSQAQRERALRAFTAGHLDALVATDVAARGIHVDGIACVVHFDPPADAKDYVHRSGRTGRAGADGAVVTLVTDEVTKAVTGLQRALGQPRGTTEPDLASLPRVPLAPRPAQETRPRSAERDAPGPHRPRRGGGGRPGGNARTDRARQRTQRADPAGRSAGSGHSTRSGRRRPV
jgi:superfamily II DNA/RNA helicase